MGIVDKVMGSLSSHETRNAENKTHTQHGTASGVEALAEGRPSEVVVDDRIGGTHTRNVKDAVTHENVDRHAHHEVTPVVDRTRDETEIHQKVQPVVDQREVHTHHQHQAPEVRRERAEDVPEAAASKYQTQAHHEHSRQVGEQTHSTSVNAPKVHEHVNKHIVEEIQPVIERQVNSVEHHHTTQPIQEHVQHAPRVHDVHVEKPIHISEFANATQTGTHAQNPLHSHGAKDVVVDERRGEERRV